MMLVIGEVKRIFIRRKVEMELEEPQYKASYKGGVDMSEWAQIFIRSIVFILV